jgi:signal transduction histidine kinase
MNEDGAMKGLNVVSAIEREQRLIGHELHDNICQTLAGASIMMETIGRGVSAGKPISPQAIKDMARSLELAIDQTRALSQRYRPTDLKGAGLMNALEKLAKENSGCTFRCEKAIFLENAEKSLAIYRIAQEAVRNAVQHADAKKIRIILQKVRGNVILQVKDDGEGFTVREEEAVCGMAVMQYRAAAVGGVLRVKSRRGSGTTVSLCVPMK